MPRTEDCVTFEDLLHSISDTSCDAVELTRRALVLAQERASAYEVAANEREGIELSHAADRKLVEVLSAPSTLSMTRTIRSKLEEALREGSATSADPLREGVEAVLAHRLALALEETHGARFHAQLAAAGRRILEPHDLVPFSSPFNNPDDPFRAAYQGDLAPQPAKLGIPPGSLRSRARLCPTVPHAARLEWDPTWQVLDDLEPDSNVDAVLPGTTLDFDTDLERKVFFDVRPKQPATCTSRALELLSAADESGTPIVVLPEVCLDAAGLEEVACWVEEESTNICVAVCGSAHRPGDGCFDNVAFIAAPKEADTYRRVEQPKLVPFKIRPKKAEPELEEDIRRAGRTLVLLSGERHSLLVLICMDFIDTALGRFAADLRPSLVLVPACSETTGVFGTQAAAFAASQQSHVVVVNQHPGKGNPAASLLARPRRETHDILKTDASHTPGIRRISLSIGDWDVT